MLEQEIGAELVVRSSRHVTLTSAGSQAFADARDLLSRVNQLEQHARRAADGDRGYVSLGFNLDYLRSPLASLLAGFQRIHSGVRVQSRLDKSQSLADDVTAGRLDLAFLTPPLLSRSQSLIELELTPVEIVGVLPKGHPGADEHELDLKCLREDSFVLPRANLWMGFYIQLSTIFDEAGFVPNIVHEVENTSMMTELVKEGVGVSLATEGSIDRSIPELTFPRLLSPNARVRQSLVWRRDNRSSILPALLDTIRTDRDR